MGDLEHLTESARTNYVVLMHMHADIYHIETQHDWDKVKLTLGLINAVIDGLCGTGATML